MRKALLALVTVGLTFSVPAMADLPSGLSSASGMPSPAHSSGLTCNTLGVQADGAAENAMYADLFAKFQSELPGAHLDVDCAPSTSKPRRVSVRLATGDEVAKTTLTVRPDGALVIHGTDVQGNKDEKGHPIPGKVSYQGRGLSELMLARALVESPGTTRIATDALVKDNRTAYAAALGQGKTPAQALEATPAYKIRAKFGFTKLDEAKSKLPAKADQTIYFELTRELAKARPASSSSSSTSTTPEPGPGSIKLVGPTTATVNACVPGFRVTRVGGDTSKVTSGSIDVSGACAYFYSDASCKNVARGFEFDAAHPSHTFYFKAECGGPARAEASGSRLGDSKLTITVPEPPKKH